MKLIGKFNKEFRFLLCITDIFSKYAWVVRCRQSQSKGRKPNKIWVDKGSEICNSSFKNG